MTYYWYRVDGVIPTKAVGERRGKLVIPSVVVADEGQYYCITEMFGHCAVSNRTTVKVDSEKIIGVALVIQDYALMLQV